MDKRPNQLINSEEGAREITLRDETDSNYPREAPFYLNVEELESVHWGFDRTSSSHMGGDFITLSWALPANHVSGMGS